MAIGASGDTKFGCIDENGEEKIALENRMMSDFSLNGLAMVSKQMDDDYKYAFINKKDEMAIEYQTGFANSFSKNDLACVKKNIEGKWGYIDKMGNR